MNVVDVRDVAQAHLHALTVPEAAGHRHIVSTKSMWFKEIAEVKLSIVLLTTKDIKLHRDIHSGRAA